MSEESGLEIKDIKQFFIWVSEAAPVMKKGKNYLKPENQLLKLKSKNFKKTLSLLKSKCWYYETAMKDDKML